jgi:hypothetical protein
MFAAVLTATVELGAQSPSDQTYLEFASPVRIPGTTLPPGTYLFVVGRPVGGQSIVDVYSADGERLLATCLTIETALPRPAASTTVDFPGISPATLRAWFPLRKRRGLEFVFMAAEGHELFTAAGVPVTYAAFKTANRDLVGAFQVRRVTAAPVLTPVNAATVAPAFVGTSGATVLLTRVDESLDPAAHLTAARRAMKTQASRSPEPFRTLLGVLTEQLPRLQSAYLRSDRAQTAVILRMIENSIVSLMPTPADLTMRRRQPLPRDLLLSLERVQAHLRAFARTAGR